MRAGIAAIVLCAAVASAADFRVGALLHGIPVEGLLSINTLRQTWGLDVRSTPTAAFKTTLAITGTYLRLANGDLVGCTTYDNACVTIRPSGAKFVHQANTIDFRFTSITPLP